MSNSDRRRGPGGRGRTNRPADVRQRAQELCDSGMPFQMAMAVAQGRLDLNEALERLARRAEVDRLMDKHDISRALATQVAMGHADLEAFLSKRRLKEHREANLNRSCLDAAVESGAKLALCVHGGGKLMVFVKETTPYGVIVEDAKTGDASEVHKLQIKYAYDPDLWKKVRKVLRTDKELSAAPKAPVERPQDRYTCSDKRLFRFMDKGTKVDVTLLEGEVLRGLVSWFGRYEFGLQLRDDTEVTIFRHALHRIRPA